MFFKNNELSSRIKILKVFTLILFAFSHFQAFGKFFEKDGIYYNNDNAKDQEVYVAKGPVPYSGDLIIPATVEYEGIEYSVVGNIISTFSGTDNLINLTIPSTFRFIKIYGGCPNLENIYVEEGSPYFTSVDGVLYNADLTTLERWPSGKEYTQMLPSVNYIAYGAFWDNNKLTDITIPDGMTFIDNCTFTGSSVKNVVLPESIERIGWDAFRNCERLTSINFPKNLVNFSNNAFANCTSLKEVNFPDSEISFGPGAFADCSSLTSFRVPDKTKTFSASEIAGCENLKYLYIGKSLSYGHNADGIPIFYFYDLPNLETVEISEENPYMTISEGVIYDKDFKTLLWCTPATTKVTFPETLQAIGDSAFIDCKKLTGIDIPENIDVIYMGTFAGCTGLSYINLPQNLTSIGAEAFVFCTFKTIVIPENVTQLGSLAFYECFSLRNIVALSPEPPVMGEYVFVPQTYFYPIYETTQLFVPEGSVELYQNAKYWGDIPNIIPLTTENYPVASINNFPVSGMEVGVTTDLSASVTSFLNIYNSDFAWSSSNPEVASVNEIGVLSANAIGETIITVSLLSWPEISASYNLQVTKSADEDSGDNDNEDNNSGDNDNEDNNSGDNDDNGDNNEDPDPDAGVEAIEITDQPLSVYTLNGILVLQTNDYQDLSKLPKGIYIINGHRIKL